MTRSAPSIRSRPAASCCSCASSRSARQASEEHRGIVPADRRALVHSGVNKPAVLPRRSRRDEGHEGTKLLVGFGSRVLLLSHVDFEEWESRLKPSAAKV